jgi:NAD(P)-dependent dehydrogenase (short-subunit alcohol dehydrogenase family)
MEARERTGVRRLIAKEDAMAALSKAVLISGCSTGIGRATAERLAGRGWTVYATARNVDTIAGLRDAGCRLLPLDVCDEGSMRDAVRTVEEAEGAVGVLINNAGYGQEGTVEEVPMDVVRRQFETNVFGLVRLSQLVLPGMRRQRWGKIVNLSSMGGRLTFPGGGFYHATKHAVEALSDALRFEVRPFGVDVIVIEPGPIKTRFGDTATGSLAPFGSDESPYRAFNALVAQRIHEAYEGPLAAFAKGPEAVAATIEKAITAQRPRSRYAITAAARGLMALRRWLPDRAFDAFLRTQFTPRAGA